MKTNEARADLKQYIEERKAGNHLASFKMESLEALLSDEDALKIANRAYNSGFRDAGGVVEDDAVPAEGVWEHSQLLRFIKEAREDDAG